MKFNFRKIIFPILAFVFFALSMCLKNGDVIQAGNSLNMYFPRHAASGYNADGTATYGELVIYTYNDGSGYPIDDKNLRIYSITVEGTTYNRKDHNITDYYTVTKLDKDTDLKNYPGITKSGDNFVIYGQSLTITNGVSVIKFDLNKFLDEKKITSSDNYIDFRFGLQLKDVWAIFNGGWGDPKSDTIYFLQTGDSSVAAKGTSGIGVPITSSVLASEIEITGATIYKGDDKFDVNANDKEGYYVLSDLNDKKTLRLALTTSVHFNGQIKVSVNDVVNEKYYLWMNYDETKASWIADIKLDNLQDVDGSITFNGCTFAGHDNYETPVTHSYSCSIPPIKIDTKIPVLESATIQGDGGATVLFDKAEVTLTLKYSENTRILAGTHMVFLNVKKSANTNISIPQELVFDTEQKCPKSCNFPITISGESGEYSVYSVTFKVEDDRGNSVYQTVATMSDKSITLKSSFEGIKLGRDVVTDNQHYYVYDSLTIQVVFDQSFNLEQIGRADIYIGSNKISDVGSAYNDKYQIYVNLIDEPYKDVIYEGTLKLLLYKNGVDYNDENNAFVVREYTNIHVNEYVTLTNVNVVVAAQNIDIKMADFGDNNRRNVKVEKTKIAVNGMDNKTGDFNCDDTNNIDSLWCKITFPEDGVYDISISKGAFTLDNGQQNSVSTFTVDVATAGFVYIQTHQVEDMMYYGSNSQVKFDFSEDKDYGSQTCAEVKFYMTSEIEVIESKCFNNSDKSHILTFDLPDKDITKLEYYIYEGANKNIKTAVVTVNNLKYRAEVRKDNVNIYINDQNIFELDYDNAEPPSIANGKLPYNKIEYYIDDTEDGTDELWDSYTIKVDKQGGETISCDGKSCTEVIGEVTDKVNVTVTISDKVGNTAEYKLSVYVDTVAPGFEGILREVTEIQDPAPSYKVCLNFTNAVSTDIAKIYVDGAEKNIELNSRTVCFNTTNESYSLKLVDIAGNESILAFPVVSPRVEFIPIKRVGNIYQYEMRLQNFDNYGYTIQMIKYLVFADDSISEENIQIARNEVCSAGRKYNCYVEIVSQNGFTNRMVLNFDVGYSYVVDIVIDDQLIKDTSGQTPMLNVIVDDDAPEVGVMATYNNPAYVSSVSGREFIFEFTATDEHLDNDFSYLIIQYNRNFQMTTDMFNKLHNINNYCAIATEIYCVTMGTGEFDESPLSGNTYRGEIVLVGNDNVNVTNTNVKKRMRNGEYIIYVMVKDESNNLKVSAVGLSFTNVVDGPIVEYKKDNGSYSALPHNGSSDPTSDTTKVRVSEYQGIQIEELKINGSVYTCNGGCEYDLSKNIHVVEVKDVLGNYKKVTIYSGTDNDPIIDIYYLYNGSYLKVTDTELVYNKINADKLYIKLTNATAVNVSMANNRQYEANSDMFIGITQSEYGMSLQSIMDAHNESGYSGSVTLVANNNVDGAAGVTSLTLTVDNVNPEFSLKLPAEKAVALYGKQYDLGYVDSQYYIQFTYKGEITYLVLMEALEVKVDGISFANLIKNNRFKFVVDGEAFNANDFSSTITKGEKVIALDYFDAAGNSAEGKIINIVCVDDQAPNINLINPIYEGEINVNNAVNLVTKINISDNHDDINDLVLTAKIISIDGEARDEAIEIKDYVSKYTFKKLGTYVIEYTVSDTVIPVANFTTLTQTVVIRDFTAPVGENISYTVNYGEQDERNIPVFIDNDPESLCEPYKYEVYNPQGILMDNTTSLYPLVVSDGKMLFGHVDELPIGTYQIKIYAKDNSNNISVATYTVTVIDNIAPELIIVINGKEYNDGDEITFAWNRDIPEFVVSAFDMPDGDLSNRIQKQIVYKGKRVDFIDKTKSGEYEVTYVVTDYSGNQTSYTLIAKVEEDKEAPIIEEFKVNNVVIDEFDEEKQNYGKVNSTLLEMLVDAMDNQGSVRVEIEVYREDTPNNNFILSNGEKININSNLSGVRYNAIVTVTDESNNETIKTYKFIVDNTAPAIYGVENHQTYFEERAINVIEANEMEVKIYRNNVLNNTYTSNIFDMVISKEGIYTIVAKDIYNNVSEVTFMIKNDKVYNVVDANNEANVYDFASTSLVLAQVNGDTITLFLEDFQFINQTDRIFILVNYPNSNYKYIANMMDGTTYLANDTITIESEIIPGISNVDLLEKIGDEYYAYLMVAKSSDNENPGKNNTSNKDLKTLIFSILGVLGIGLLFIAIIKLRRRVRAA